jgi:predicted nucleotidyltransferase
MELRQVDHLLLQNRLELDRHGVKSLAVFGSVARGEATENSDLDVLVEFSRPVGLFEFIRLKKFLEDLTENQVDLVTKDALHPAMRESILSEAKYVG